MKKCSGCHSVEYCSKECESAHWKDHKTSCKASKAEADDHSPSEKSVKSQCARCKKSDVALKKCFHCNNVEYCSDVCQKDDWKHQQTSCKTSKTADGACSSEILVNERCQQCKHWNDHLKYCTGCHKVKYCNKYCQEIDWLYHKENCYSTDNRKGSTFPIPKSVEREIARMFPFQTVLTKFDEVTAVDKLPLTHSRKEEKLIAYIFKKGYHPFRLHHEIRDVTGEIRHVMFYLTEFISEPYFRWDQLKVGNYIVIIKPQIHYFVDGHVGFRIDSLNVIRIIDNNSH
uniref:MYND-type domain-containing protein n=1 Tax=Octopus bimaculoides TaxID=37653 RepID=A0A0L8GQN0_OCTBM|eukprot:XP_014778994.1 PREDICTED: uncharacterized protein LOC106875397 [Octopus bimaculoides]